MSASSSPFKEIHRDYKRLNRIKALVRLQSTNRSDVVDIFEVYSFRLKELLDKAKTECTSSTPGPTTLRLAAIQLALLYDHLEALMHSSSPSSPFSKESPSTLSSTSIAMLNAELQQAIDVMQKFHQFRLNDVLSFVYLKLYHLLAKIVYNPLKNFTVARQLFQATQEMCVEMRDQHEKQSPSFYGWRELFAKSSQLKPMTTTDQIDTIEQLSSECAALLQRIDEIEPEHGENDDRTDPGIANIAAMSARSRSSSGGGDGDGTDPDGAGDNDARSIFDAIQMYHQDHPILLGKLLSSIPTVLKQRQWKMSAYLLLVAHKLAIKMTVAAATNTQIVDVKVRSSIMTNWMRYIFGVLNGAAWNWRQLFGSAGKMRFAAKFGNIIGDGGGDVGGTNYSSPSHESFSKTDPNSEMFGCFAQLIPLAADELALCISSMQTIADGERLIAYTLQALKQLLAENDFRLNPMDFISHHYQIFDLLAIATVLTANRNRCFEYQADRFQLFIHMMRSLNEYCPQLYGALVANFMCDLNEIILDLYAVNFDRCVSYEADDSPADSEDNGNNGRGNCSRRHRQELQLITKLNEVHVMTQQFMATIKPI